MGACAAALDEEDLFRHDLAFRQHNRARA
jgi:hypothetical protein